MSPKRETNYGLGYVEGKARKRPIEVHSVSEVLSTVGLLFSEEGHRFNFECCGEWCPTFRRFKKLYRQGAPVHAVLVVKCCVFRFRVDRLGTGLVALRGLRKLIAAQLKRRFDLKTRKVKPVRKVRFVRGANDNNDVDVNKNVVARSYRNISWAPLPDPMDVRVAGSILEAPAERVVRSVAGFGRGETSVDELPGLLVSSVLQSHVHEGRFIAPIAGSNYRGSESDFMVSVAVQHAESGMRFESRFDAGDLRSYFSEPEPSGGDTNVRVDAFERLEREQSVVEDTPLVRLLRESSGGGSSESFRVDTVGRSVRDTVAEDTPLRRLMQSAPSGGDPNVRVDAFERLAREQSVVEDTSLVRLMRESSGEGSSERFRVDTVTRSVRDTVGEDTPLRRLMRGE